MRKNIYTIKGNTIDIDVQNTFKSGIPVNIFWGSFKFTAKEYIDSSVNIFQITGNLIAPAYGIVNFRMEAENTKDFPVWVFYYDIEYTDVDWNVATILEGNIKISYNITQ